MSYYIIRRIGNIPHIDSIDNYSFKDTLVEREGKYFITDTYSDIYDEVRECEIQVYSCKKEAWKVALQRMDDFIAELQKEREEAFHKALDDGAFVKTPEEYKKWIDGIRGDETTDLFEKRNKVK